MAKQYAVMGATGHTGAQIAASLLAAGHQVRVVGRAADRLAPLVAKGAEAAVGSVEDADFVARALSGTDAAYLMIPPNFALQSGFRAYQNRVTENFVSALGKSGTKHVVTLSSVGAHLDKGNGPVGGLYDMEQRLNSLTQLNILHLRPTFFLENHLNSIAMIKNMNILGSPMRADVAVPQIATDDIGKAAAARLLECNFSGHTTQELLGAKDLTMTEVATVFGKAIGKPDLKYAQFPYADAEKAMIQMGISPEMAQMYCELQRGFNEGSVRPTETRSAKNTTATTVEAFAEKVFAPAFRA